MLIELALTFQVLASKLNLLMHEKLSFFIFFICAAYSRVICWVKLKHNETNKLFLHSNIKYRIVLYAYHVFLQGDHHSEQMLCPQNSLKYPFPWIQTQLNLGTCHYVCAKYCTSNALYPGPKLKRR